MSIVCNNPKNFDQIALQQSRQIEPISGFSTARWKVGKSTVVYHNSKCHTLSLYLAGGETSYRVDHNSKKGAPGMICLMPQGQDSEWHINGDIDFVHLYFSDDILRHYATTTLQTDVRYIELKDLLYQQDNKLKRLFIDYVKLAGKETLSSPLFAEEAMHKVLHHLLTQHNGFALAERKIQGGLSTLDMNLSRDLIEQNLNQKLTIAMLSKEVNLSPFHFARMFKISFGESPANFITRRRVTLVKSLLDTDIPLAAISVDAGFSQQSHMTNSFRKQIGLTPAIYRKRLMTFIGKCG